jgi:hypothetical protein
VKVNSGLLVRGLIPELRRRIVVNFAHQFYPALRIGIVDIGIKLTVRRLTTVFEGPVGTSKRMGNA